MIKLNQSSKWQLHAIKLTSYDDGVIYTDTAKLVDFKDLTKQYLVVVYYGNHNGLLKTTRTDDYKKAQQAYDQRHNYLGMTHAAIVTTSSDTDTIKNVQGRDSYRVLASEGDVLLMKPKGVYL